MPGSLLVADLDTLPVVGNAAGDGLGDARLVEMEDLVFGVAGQSLGDEEVGLGELAVVVEPQRFLVVGLGRQFALSTSSSGSPAKIS